MKDNDFLQNRSENWFLVGGSVAHFDVFPLWDVQVQIKIRMLRGKEKDPPGHTCSTAAVLLLG